MDRMALIPVGFVPFPGAVIELELADRDTALVFQDYMDRRRDVGFLFHDEERFGAYRFEMGGIGCAAEIRAVYGLDGTPGRVVAHAHSRFELMDELELDSELPEGVVRTLEDAPPADPAALRRKREHTVGLFHAALRALPGSARALPKIDCSEDVSFRMARFLGSSTTWQQRFLEARDELTRLERLEMSFLQAIARFQAPTPDAAVGDPG